MIDDPDKYVAKRDVIHTLPECVKAILYQLILLASTK